MSDLQFESKTDIDTSFFEYKDRQYKFVFCRLLHREGFFNSKSHSFKTVHVPDVKRNHSCKCCQSLAKKWMHLLSPPLSYCNCNYIIISNFYCVMYKASTGDTSNYIICMNTHVVTYYRKIEQSRQPWRQPWVWRASRFFFSTSTYYSSCQASTSLSDLTNDSCNQYWPADFARGGGGTSPVEMLKVLAVWVGSDHSTSRFTVHHANVQPLDQYRTETMLTTRICVAFMRIILNCFL